MIVGGCDFSPPIYKQIIKAQESIYHQDYKDAIERYNLVLNSGPEKEIKIKIFFQLSNLHYVYLGEGEKAIFYLEEIKKISVDPLWLIKVEENLGEINFNFQKNYFKSLQNYKRLTQFVPKLEKFDFYQFRLAESFYNAQMYEDALVVFKEIQQNSSHKYFLDSLFYIGKSFFQQKNWKSAIKFFKEYIRRERDSDKITQAKFLMANSYETLESLKIAYDIYYSILSSYPNTEVIQNRLNSIYKRRVARRR